MGLLFPTERRQWAPEPVIPPYPGWTAAPSTAVTNKEQALTNSVVWSCVGTIANSVSLMALETFTRHGNSGEDVPRRVIPDPAIVMSPSPGVTQADFLNQVMVSALLRGNTYGFVPERDARGKPSSIELLDPDSVNPRMVAGKIQYWVNGVQVPNDQIWHFRGMTLPGCKVGLSPIAFGALTMGVELSAAKFARDFFDGGGVPKAVLESDLMIDEVQARTLKNRLIEATRNREPIALGMGVKYVPISVKPDESQFVATLQNSVAQTARFFFMPPEMVGGSSGQSMTYASREQRALDYATYTISPWLKRIEDAYYQMLPRPQFVSFNESNLLRTDAETQAKVRVTYVAGKVLPPSRILRAMNEQPLTDDEKTELELVPLTVTPTGMPKALPMQPTPETSPDTPNVAPTKTKAE